MNPCSDESAVTYVWQWQVGSATRSGSSGTTVSVGRASGASRTPIHDSSDHRDRPENAEPRLKNEPAEPTDSTDPTLPIERTE